MAPTKGEVPLVVFRKRGELNGEVPLVKPRDVFRKRSLTPVVYLESPASPDHESPDHFPEPPPKKPRGVLIRGYHGVWSKRIFVHYLCEKMEDIMEKLKLLWRKLVFVQHKRLVRGLKDKEDPDLSTLINLLSEEEELLAAFSFHEDAMVPLSVNNELKKQQLVQIEKYDLEFSLKLGMTDRLESFDLDDCSLMDVLALSEKEEKPEAVLKERKEKLKRDMLAFPQNQLGLPKEWKRRLLFHFGKKTISVATDNLDLEELKNELVGIWKKMIEVEFDKVRNLVDLKFAIIETDEAASTKSYLKQLDDEMDHLHQKEEQLFCLWTVLHPTLLDVAEEDLETMVLNEAAQTETYQEKVDFMFELDHFVESYQPGRHGRDDDSDNCAGCRLMAKFEKIVAKMCDFIQMV